MVRDSNGTATGALRGWGETTADLPADRHKEDEEEGQGRRNRSRSREGRWSRGRELQKNDQVRRGSAGKGDAWRSRARGGKDGGGKGAGKDRREAVDFGWSRSSGKGAPGGRPGGGRRGGGGKEQGGKREKELPSEKDLDQALNAYFGKESPAATTDKENSAATIGKENPAATTTHNITAVDSEAEKKLKEARAKRFGLQAETISEAAPTEAEKPAAEAKPAAAPEANEGTAVAAEPGTEDAKRLEREKRFAKVPTS